MKNRKSIVLISALLLACMAASAQEISLIQPKLARKITTAIKADLINIDIARNIAAFTGNVKYDDGKTLITCDKMIIILEDRKAGSSSASSIDENKQISRISCKGKVVVVMKDQVESGKGDPGREIK